MTKDMLRRNCPVSSNGTVPVRGATFRVRLARIVDAASGGGMTAVITARTLFCASRPTPINVRVPTLGSGGNVSALTAPARSRAMIAGIASLMPG